jgi:hypothetical protein
MCGNLTPNPVPLLAPMRTTTQNDESMTNRPTTFDLIEDGGKLILYVHTGEMAMQLDLDRDHNDRERLRRCLEQEPTTMRRQPPTGAAPDRSDGDEHDE